MKGEAKRQAVRRALGLTVWLVLLGSLPCSAADGLRVLRQGEYEAAVSGSGSLSLSVSGTRIVNYEMLQLIGGEGKWVVVFVYGKDGDPRREFAREAGAPVCRIARDVPKVISYRKQVTVAEDGISWYVDYTAPANTGARANYYFIDIPMELLSGAVASAETDGGKRFAILDPEGASNRVLLSGLQSVTFLSDRLALSFTLGGENVSWRLTDWTASVHRSYRLRIENPCPAGIRARVEVKVSARKSSPDVVAQKKQELKKMAEAKQQKRLTDLGIRSRKRLKIGAVKQNVDAVGRCEKLELTFPLEATFDNPFDPEQIDVICRIKTPSGKTVEVPAFFYQDFKRRAEPGTGYVPVGRPVWKVRFAPGEVGKYEYRVSAKDRSGTVESEPGHFECAASKTTGYVRVSRKNPYYFELDSGAAYIPIGLNLFISTRLGQPIPPDRLDRCENYINRIADHGGNFIRLRMDSWWNTIEMSPDEVTGYLGLGYYHQGACWEADRIYELAARRGVYIMHCLDNANGNVNLRPSKDGSRKNAWRDPYDLYLKSNGGVTDSHQAFWTDETVRRFVRNKLRYVTARWGWSTHCMCWEFWNEVALRKDVIDAIAAWHRDTARYLRSIDPYKHPITTSLMGDHSLLSRVFGLPEIEISQLHSYSRQDVATAENAMCRENTDAFKKPFFVGEFGVPPTFARNAWEWDPDGLHLHNGLWAAMFSRGAGPGAHWYISSFVDVNNLYRHFRPFADFVRRVNWLDPELVTMPVFDARWEKLPETRHYVDFIIPTGTKWAMRKAPVFTFDIGDDGAIEHGEMLQPMLHHSPERGAPPTFQVHFREPGQFCVHVNLSVGSENNKLVIHLDGKQVVEKPFPAGKGHGLKTEYVEQYDNYRTTYDDTVTIDVPAGDHEIRVEMRGKDRLEVGYSLRNYLCFEKSRPIRVFGVKTKRSAYLWAQNKRSTWDNQHMKLAPIPVEGMRADIAGLEDGAYTVEWWEPWKGGVVSSTTAEAKGGTLFVTIPKTARDLACRIVKGK